MNQIILMQGESNLLIDKDCFYVTYHPISINSDARDAEGIVHTKGDVAEWIRAVHGLQLRNVGVKYLG